MKKFDKRKVVTGALVVAVAVSSFAVSGTYARYASEATSSDKARVAVWGWKDDNTLTLDLFKDTYKAIDDATKTDVESSTTDAAGNKEKVIAPGTSGITGFGLPTFKPETNYTITLAAENTSSIATELQGKLKFYTARVSKTYYNDNKDKMSLRDGKLCIDGTVDNSITLSDAKTSISDAVDTLNEGTTGLKNKVFAANSAADDEFVYLIGWEWEIGSDTGDLSDTNIAKASVGADGKYATTDLPKVVLDLKATYIQSENAAK